MGIVIPHLPHLGKLVGLYNLAQQLKITWLTIWDKVENGFKSYFGSIWVDLLRLLSPLLSNLVQDNSIEIE